MRIPVSPASTKVAIERTPSDSAARGTTFTGVGSARGPLDTPAAVDFEARARDHRRLVGGKEDRGVRDVLGSVEPTDLHCRVIALPPLAAPLRLAPDRR